MIGLLLGLVFLWLPILLLVGYAFSGATLPFTWGGFSLRWFAALGQDTTLLHAAWLSLQLAVASASLSTVLGGIAGWGLARAGAFGGRPLFGVLAGAPLVLPDIVLGLALLLLFVTLQQVLGWPAGRGMLTLLAAHTTLSMAYVTALIQARLAEAVPALEEAAADLGAGAFTVLHSITLPLAAPALGAGWLLAFTLSLDDVVLASFASGPGSTTLPMLIFSRLRLGITPELNALATVILALAGLVLVLAGWLLRARRAGTARRPA